MGLRVLLPGERRLPSASDGHLKNNLRNLLHKSSNADCVLQQVRIQVRTKDLYLIEVLSFIASLLLHSHRSNVWHLDYNEDKIEE